MKIMKDHNPNYLIDKFGNIYKVYKNGKLKKLKPFENSKGYLRVQFCRKKVNGLWNHFVHRLVAHYFIKPIPTSMVINHTNYNRHDNRVDNLEIITQKENIIHRDLRGKQ